MKWLLIALILLCLVGVMACEKEVIGDYPIVNLGDTLAIQVTFLDSYHIFLSDFSCSVTVFKHYDQDSTLTFSDTFYGIKHIHVVELPGPGDDLL